MKFRFIDQAKEEFPAYRLCKVLGVSQSGYFSWKDRPASHRQREDMIMLAHVRSAYALSHETYGSPRMTRELQDSGFAIGRRRTARLMRENGLHARQKRRFKRTTDSQHAFPVAPNIIDQDFVATGPNQKWGVDISYVWTREGWLYLAVVIDLFSRRVVGWAVGDRLHRELAINALRKAIVMRRPKPRLIHHSDRGSQYCSIDYQALLRSKGIVISMSGKGNCRMFLTIDQNAPMIAKRAVDVTASACGFIREDIHQIDADRGSFVPFTVYTREHALKSAFF